MHKFVFKTLQKPRCGNLRRFLDSLVDQGRDRRKRERVEKRCRFSTTKCFIVCDPKKSFSANGFSEFRDFFGDCFFVAYFVYWHAKTFMNLTLFV